MIIGVSKLNGKLEGFRAIGTNTRTNKFCVKMNSAKKETICKFCYSHATLEKGMYKDLEPFLQSNTEVLGNTILKEYVFRQGSTVTQKLNDAYFRFQQHGELINMTHFVNLMNIALDNPKTTFACWTKRKDILNKYRKENDIPENVIMVYSNPEINKILDAPPEGFDKVFNNVWKDHAVEKQNCTGQKCMDCLRCYDKEKENVIVEAVK